MAFKMKGSPLHRNFGLGGPMKKKEDSKEKKLKAITEDTKTEQSDNPGLPEGTLDARVNYSDEELLASNKHRRENPYFGKPYGKDKDAYEMPRKVVKRVQQDVAKELKTK